ncbi:MAG: hypothetical protein ACREJB_13140, partial [Planctomycetaceae bacterium]
MATFEELIASRKRWIEEVLRPWCRGASRADLRRAELEWQDIAGRADPAATLWTWAWGRFPALVHGELPGVDETHRVCVTMTDGESVTGFPDGRRSRQGELYLLCEGAAGALVERGPYSIDEIAAVER